MIMGKLLPGVLRANCRQRAPTPAPRLGLVSSSQRLLPVAAVAPLTPAAAYYNLTWQAWPRRAPAGGRSCRSWQAKSWTRCAKGTR